MRNQKRHTLLMWPKPCKYISQIYNTTELKRSNTLTIKSNFDDFLDETLASGANIKYQSWYIC